MVFHPDAQAELNLAINHDDDYEASLGNPLAIEACAAVERIKAIPRLWPLLNDAVRRCLIHRFPDGLIGSFDESQSTTLIQAIVHLHRQPGYWSERL